MKNTQSTKLAPPYFIGIDNGLTNIKAVIFTLDGKVVGSGHVLGSNSSPKPHWVERDMNLIWEWVCVAIQMAIKSAGVSPKDIKAAGLAAHGDGAFLLDRNLKPVRPAVLSLDSRSSEICKEWEETGALNRTLQISGQKPFVGSLIPIMGWLKRNEPENYENTRWLLYCKDWIRFKLTGEVATDFTESSSTATDVQTQLYDPGILRILGLDELIEKLPPEKMPYEAAGKVTRQAAVETGLSEGTVVATGLHDVDSCAVSMGCLQPGQLSIISGTWGINQVITPKPVINDDWLCRNFIKPGLWLNCSASPASAANLEWMVQNLCQDECIKAEHENRSRFDFVNQEIEEILEEKSQVFFIPFLYGSPFGEKPSSCFIGIKGWHRRAHLLKAIFEGVVFNHKHHVESLRKCSEFTDVRLSGGGAKSLIWSQLFADALNVPISIPDIDEAGALGASLCAATSVGYYNSIEEAASAVVKIARTHTPNPTRHEQLDNAYAIYCDIVKTLLPVWEKIS